MALREGIISAWGEGRPVPTSRMVQPTPDGALRYSPDRYGNTLPDFSHAGFRGGGVPLPVPAEIPVKATVAPGEDVQAAIDAVSVLPMSANGYRGAVLLQRGRHPIDVAHRLTVVTSGVVLRGEGAGEDGTLLIGVGPFAKPDIGYEGGVPIGLAAAGGAPPQRTLPELSSGGLVQFVGEAGVTEAAVSTQAARPPTRLDLSGIPLIYC